MRLLDVLESAPKIASDVGIGKIVFVKHQGSYNVAKVRVEGITYGGFRAARYEDIKRDFLVDKRGGKNAHDVALVISALTFVVTVDDDQACPSPAACAPAGIIAEKLLLGL